MLRAVMDVFLNILRRVEHEILRQIARNQIALPGNFTAVRMLQAGEDFQERRLAAAVAPDEADAVAFLNAERNIVKHGALVVAQSDFGGGNDGGHANFRISEMTNRVESKVMLSLANYYRGLGWPFCAGEINNYFMNLIKSLARGLSSSKLVVLVSIFTGV